LRKRRKLIKLEEEVVPKSSAGYCETQTDVPTGSFRVVLHDLRYTIYYNTRFIVSLPTIHRGTCVKRIG